MQGDVLRGHLDSMLLAVVRRRPLHGYAIAEELRERSGGSLSLPEGTIYPALHRLERDGLLVSGWATVDGRRRRVYRMTERGRAAFADKRAEWKQLTGLMGALLEGKVRCLLAI